MNENVYFECRKRAAIHNERLNSRAGAAEILGISESTLAHYELGITKNIPVDVVVMMAEVYNAPELKCIYCKSECPIGKELFACRSISTEMKMPHVSCCWPTMWRNRDSCDNQGIILPIPVCFAKFVLSKSSR